MSGKDHKDKITKGKQQVNQTGGDTIHNFSKSRAGGVFALAGLAAGAALLLVWGAWSTLEGATQDQRIAPPPDLKSVVESVEAKGEQIAERALHEGRAEAQVPQ